LEPSPHVLADADAVRTSLIKPAAACRELFAGGLGDADQATRTEAVSQKLKPRRHPAHERFVGVLATFNAQSVSLTMRIAARSFQRVGASTTQSAMKRT